MSVVGLDNSVNYSSCDPNAQEKAKLRNILHWAIEDGKSTGVVTNTRLTHATPASTYAHSTNRDWENDLNVPFNYRGSCADIASQMTQQFPGNKINVLFGGGSRNYFTTRDAGHRGDLNLIEKWMKEEGTDRKFVKNVRELRQWSSNSSEQVIGLFAKSHLPYEVDRDPLVDPSLSEMTKIAIERLEIDSHGFVLLVEGGRIDHAHHSNLAKRAFEEVMEFDKTINVIILLIHS